MEDVHDVWICYRASKCDFTYFSPQYNSYTQIDMFLVDKLILQKVFSSTIADITWSNHAAIFMSLLDVDTNQPVFV